MGRSFLSWVSGGVNRLCFSISDKLEMDTDTEKLIFFSMLDSISKHKFKTPRVFRILDFFFVSSQNSCPQDIWNQGIVVPNQGADIKNQGTFIPN